MRYGDGERLALAEGVGEGQGGALHAQALGLAPELEAGVSHQRAGKQPGLAENLKAVATSDDRPARLRERRDRPHHRREPRDGAGPEVVAVGESARDDEAIEARDIGLFVKDGLRARADRVFERAHPVAVRPRAGEDEHAVAGGGHAPCSSSSPTIRPTALPSALPLSWGITLPITLPRSPGPDAPNSLIACRARARISSSSACAGR